MRAFTKICRAPVLAALAGGFATALSVPAQACGVSDSLYLGTVCSVTFNYCPQGYAQADGQLYSVEDNPALFSLIGCLFGGDCRETFAIPDIRGRVVVHQGTGPGLSPAKYAENRGADIIQSSVEGLATHDHLAVFTSTGQASLEVQASGGQGSTATPTAGVVLAAAYEAATFATLEQWAPAPGATVSLGGVSFNGPGGTVTVGKTGGGKEVSVLNPSVVMTTCIATAGLYPPRH